MRVFINTTGAKVENCPRMSREKLNKLLEQAKEGKKGLWGKDYKVMECLCR